ncbi:sulfatase family protein [Eudoraea chungangensis]|uniref:sulfatase family protein n=1 Tax=Eudoraea chungangensis TaxID=1481905 RepID=UPI0023EB0F04|nr:sulfatase [Eudoraea chungangensis]
MTNFKHLLLFILFSCCLNLSSGQTEEKPNILWIYLEDTSPLLGCYGSSLMSTPNIDMLAERGVLFQNAFMPAPVCSASRSSIITGAMSTSLGLHNHHSSRTKEAAIYLPDTVKTIPEIFIENGYFTFNNGKDDYNFTYDRQELYAQDYSTHPLYGKKGIPLKISALKNKTPFFGQIQLAGGKEIFSSNFKEKVDIPIDRSRIILPPYLPNHPAIVEEYANHLDAIQITDLKVGEIISELEKNDLLQNTVIFFFSDHGMRLTRHKQFLYDGGIHVPLIIADFSNSGRIGAGIKEDNLVSGIDLGTTAMGLAGIPIPKHMEGYDIFDKSIAPREYVISSRDRCDFTIDRIRSVRSKDYKYIRNFMPERPYTQLTYMDVDGVEFVRVMKELHQNNKLDANQNRFMLDERPREELYDLKKDPNELNNLANHPESKETLRKYTNILNAWILDTDDQGQYPEKKEDLKLMLGIWGKNAINPEYDALRKKYPQLEGSLWELKNAKWKTIKN